MLAGYSSYTLQKFLTLTVPSVSLPTRLYQPLMVGITLIIGGTIAWLPLKTAVLLVGGATFLTLLLINPTFGIYALIPVIPFSSLLAVSAGGAKVGLMEIMLLLTLTVGLMKVMVNHTLTGYPFKIETGPLLWPFLILLSGLSLSWLNTISIGASLVETAKWIEMFLLYLLVINLLSAKQIKWLVWMILLTGMSQAILGLYQFVFKIGPEGFLLFGGRFLRAYGTFAQPNPYAGYLGLTLPLALSLTIWAIQNASVPSFFKISNIQQPLYQKIIHLFYQLIALSSYIIPLGIILAALFASQSRGAWLGFAAASLVTFIVRSKKVTIIVTALAIILASIGLIGSFKIQVGQIESYDEDSAYGVILQRFTDSIAIVTITDVATAQITDANFATLERLAHWQAARNMWRDNLWVGVGFGNYAVAYPAYAVGRWQDPLGHAHNYLLNIGAETGLVGITVYLIFWISIFGVLWVIVQRSSGYFKAVVAGAIGVVVHLYVHNMVDNLYVQGMYLYVAIILGITSVIYKYNKYPVKGILATEFLEDNKE